jgi:PAS domain S-box-containing protein
VIADADGSFRLFNQGAREIAGVGLIESSPDRWSDDFGLFLEDRVTLFRAQDLPLARALRGESSDQVRMFLKNPAVPEGRLIEVTGRPWRTADGEQTGGVVVFRDVTQEEHAEKRVRFQAAILDTVPNAVMALDAEGKVVYWNRASEQLMGWRAADLIGRRARDVLLSEDEHAQVDGIRAYLLGGGIFRGDFPARRPDGTHVPILALASALKDAHGALAGFVVVGVDLTDLRSTEDALRARENDLRQFQKMEAVGRLAGGVAHDFNNLLTVIRGYMDLVLAQIGESDPVRKDALEVAHAADRAAELTGQLLAFSRHRPLRATTLKLNEVVTEFLPMLKRTLGEDIAVTARLEPDLGTVRGDAGQLGQVLLNLALNARDAMPRGGELAIVSENAELDATYPGTHVPLPPGPYVRLSVSDTGSGMDEETRARVFEPFFTTKGPGKGTGLGLSTAYGIIRQHDGAIWLYSEVGRGTTARIYLPRVFESLAVPSTPAAQPPSVGGGRTILVVEDEAAVRHVERRMLEAHGYRVLLAEGGAAALELVRAHPGTIDLLLTDVIMPEMNGREVAAAVQELRPGLPVLFVSGHVGDALDRHGGLGPEARVLSKPFSSRELVDAVRAALAPAPGARPS